MQLSQSFAKRWSGTIHNIGKIPHDTDAFTQRFRLDVATGRLFESTGLYGQSDVCKINPSIGDVINKVEMDSKYFAEGMTIFETESW